MPRPYKHQEVRRKTWWLYRSFSVACSICTIGVVVGRIEFPAEDESTGAICELCWHGPGRDLNQCGLFGVNLCSFESKSSGLPEWSDLENVVALKVLLAYLCTSADSQSSCHHGLKL